MKKVILAMVFIFATGTTMINATSSNKERTTPTKETIEVVEDFGCASDCVRSAFDQTIEEADASGEMVFISDYMANYEDCY